MKLKFAGLGLSLLMLSACTAITPVNEQYSGYLSDYSRLQKTDAPDGSQAMSWISPELKEKKYSKILVKPVGFFPAPIPNENVTIETLNKISSYMTEQVKNEIGKNFEVVDKAGPDTLYMQFAITGVSTPTKGLEAKNLIPVSLLFTGAKLAAGEQDHVVVLYLEGRVTDSENGNILAEGVRQALGENLKNDDEKLNVDKLKTAINTWAADIGTMIKKLKSAQ
jgi:hypothetical protein